MKAFLALTFVLTPVAWGFSSVPPPPSPGPEKWSFRQELAEDAPPDYAPLTGKPWLENRISRCFFSPIKRPPFNRDELKGINALSLFERYPRASARVDRPFVMRMRAALNDVCAQAHKVGT